MSDFRILGTGSFMPGYRETNEQFIARTGIESSDEWIRDKSGILVRPYVLGKHLATAAQPEWLDVEDEFEFPSAQMGAIAVRRAAEVAGIDVTSIDGLYVGTWTPDHRAPGAQDIMAQELGIEASGSDVSAACASFVEAFSHAAALLQADTNDLETIAVVGTETISKHVDWSERSNAFLFGDGAGAVILQRDNSSPGRTLWTHSGTMPDHTLDFLFVPQVGGVQMIGQSVYKTAIPAAHNSIIHSLERAGLGIDDLDFLVPHQANRRITQSLRKKLNLHEDQVVDIIDQTANSSSATVPIALDMAVREGRIHDNSILAMIGFGAGMTWSTALINTGELPKI